MAVAILALIAVASAQYLYADRGYHHGGHDTAPSFHAPWASSTSTGIRRYGSTAGGYAYGAAGIYDAIPAAYGGYYV